MTDYSEEQRNELEALESIYPDSFTGEPRRGPRRAGTREEREAPPGGGRPPLRAGPASVGVSGLRRGLRALSCAAGVAFFLGPDGPSRRVRVAGRARLGGV